MEVPYEEMMVSKYSILLTGASKEGKTQSFASLYQWLVETHAEQQSIYVYDFDDGAASLVRKSIEQNWPRGALRIFKHLRKGGRKIAANYIPQRSQDEFLGFLADFNKLYDQVDQRTGKWKVEFAKDAPGLVLLDGITSLRDIIYDYVLSVRMKDLGGKDGSGISIEEQNMFKAKMLEVINGARGLPCHCAFTAHIETRQEVAKSGSLKVDATPTGQTYQVPIIFGDMRWNLASMFDVSLYTVMPGYKWRTSGDGHIKGVGVRTNEKLPSMIDQDFRLVFGTKAKPSVLIQPITKTELDKPVVTTAQLQR